MVIALLAPIITGFRRERLGISIRIGWCLIVFAYFAADFLIPEWVERIYGREAGKMITPNNNGTLPMLFLGWILPLVLHSVGFILYELFDTVHGLWLKKRSH